MSEKILEVKDLNVSFHTYAGTSHAVRGIDFHLNQGETLAIVGESGCGKTVTSKAIMGLLPTPQTQIKKMEIPQFCSMVKIFSIIQKSR